MPGAISLLCQHGVTMSSTHMRRSLLREATGPTPDEFATHGASLLVGFISPRYSDQILNHQRLTPVDSDYARFQYLDALPVLVGSVLGAIIRKNVAPATRMAQTQARVAAKAEKRAARQEARTEDAANALLRWFESEGGDVAKLWTAPGDGNGFFFNATDEFTVRALQSKARGVAKDPRFNSYVAVIPSASPGEYLAAFVREPRLVPIDYQSAVELALAATTPRTGTHEEINDAISFQDMGDQIIAAPVSGFGGSDAVGAFLSNVFGPKKPEKIQKKIEKLEKQLAEWKEKLKEAEAKSNGMVIGNIYGPMGRFSAQERSGPNYYDYDPNMFADAADDMSYEYDVPEQWEAAMGLSRPELEAAVKAKYKAMLAAGEITKKYYAAAVDIIRYMSDDELEDELDDDDEAGFFAPQISSPSSMSSPSSTSTRRSGGGGRRKRRKHRKQKRQQRQQRQQRRQSRGQQGQQQQQPQVIVIREGGGNDGGYDDGYDDDYDDEYVDGLADMGRVYDGPMSPHGFVINYPVG